MISSLEGSPIRISKLYEEQGYIGLEGRKPVSVAVKEGDNWVITQGDDEIVRLPGTSSSNTVTSFMHGFAMGGETEFEPSGN